MFEVHQFQACRQLERCIEQLDQTGQVAAGVREAYHAYHYALVHKLRSAEYNMKRLETVPTSASLGELNMDKILFEGNMYLDGFFYCGGSALDILAREILSYFAINHPNRVYYHTARDLLNQNRPGDPLLARLADPAWKAGFSEYRNALTHELLLVDSVSIGVRMIGRTQQHEAVIPLPDDPRVPAAQRTYNSNPDAVRYVQDHFRRLVSHINVIYGALRQRINAHGALPL